MFNISDSHVHMSKGFDNYPLNKLNYINIIYNDIDEFKNDKFSYENNVVKSLIFDYRNNENITYVLEKLDQKSIGAIKIHSKIQKIEEEEHSLLLERLKLLPKGVVIIYDAFFDGSDVNHKPSVNMVVSIANLLPDSKILIAHSGGYDLLKFFFHLRHINNIIFDLSLSLQYLYDSSLRPDLVKLLKYVDKERIIFGSDYPSADIFKEYLNFLSLANDANLTEKEIEKVLNSNFKKIFINE